MIILIHSSKTMKAQAFDLGSLSLSQPLFGIEADSLSAYMRNLSLGQIVDMMKISKNLAVTVQNNYSNWDNLSLSPAMYNFVGDIYSGLQAQSFSVADLEFAQLNLRILSGLYGVLKPLDLIKPYRMEMAYKLDGFKEPNLYKFWGDKIYKSLNKPKLILNLSSDEYYKVVGGHLDAGVKVVTPKFLTVDSKTNQPKFTAVHAKIARGAFAGWVIKNRLTDSSKLNNFNQLGYLFSPELSLSEDQPVFVCKEFGGKGLSLRLR